MNAISRRTSAELPPTTCSHWHLLGPEGPEIEMFERPQGLDSVMTLRVEPPLSLVEAMVMRHKVQGLIARCPTVIVLDVAGLLPADEMGVLVLPAVTRDAAERGIGVVLTNPSRPLRDRLSQLGVHNLTFVYDSAQTVPTEDAFERDTDRHDEHAPLSPCPVCRAFAAAS